MTKKRASKIEKLERHATIRNMLSEGKAQSDIVKTCSDLWKVSETQVYNYLSEVRSMFEATAEADKKVILYDIVEKYQSLYKKAERSNKFNACVNILDKLSDLLGLYELNNKEKGTGSGKVQVVFNMPRPTHNIAMSSKEAKRIEANKKGTGNRDSKELQYIEGETVENEKNAA